MEEPDLKKAIQERDWEETSRILKDHPEWAEDQLAADEFGILWNDAPLETIRTLLEAWSGAYKEECYATDDFIGRDLVKAKSYAKQWDFLHSILLEFPQVLEMNYASTVAMRGASLEFLNTHWKETGTLMHSVHSQDWEKFREVLKKYPHLAKEGFSESEFDILWADAPLETILALLEAWPEVFSEGYGAFGTSLVSAKMGNQQWDVLKSLIHVFPNIITASDVYGASIEDVPPDVFELMLDQQPNAPVEYPHMTFNLIADNKPDQFLAVLERCHAVTELKELNIHLTPLLLMFKKKEHMKTDLIGAILKVNPAAAIEKDFDGKTALHLAYQHGASSELVEMLQQAYPEAENIRDNLGRLPKDLATQSEKSVYTPAKETLLLANDDAVKQSDGLNAEKEPYPDDAVVVCRGDMLIRDLSAPQTKEDKKTYEDYSQHVLGRHQIFETLLEEFSKMVGIDDKVVIQKAAATQALAVQYLSNKDGTIINFGPFDNPGYWFLQEVLKLVMRVYHEGQSSLEYPLPSVMNDANKCMDDLEGRKYGIDPPEPSDKHVKAYSDITQWLTDGLDKSSYTLQGPVLKPLQSLFNKLFIRRGQTSVSVIGDMVRGTLLLGNKTMLEEIVKRIKHAFPNITKFQQPDKFSGVADFLAYVHDDLDLLPDSDVLPYRFKVNSSQKNKDKPLWFNFNFFLQVPEYHRVGFSEMFVACELQIGVEAEINKHRQTHDAYERDRILSNQPLLNNYDKMIKEEEGDNKFSRMGNCTEDDNKLIEQVLFGKIASEVLIPCATEGNDDQNNNLLFGNGPISLPWSETESGSFAKPERRCVNNRSLNWHAETHGDIFAAFRAAGPYKLDGTKRILWTRLLLKISILKVFLVRLGCTLMLDHICFKLLVMKLDLTQKILFW